MKTSEFRKLIREEVKRVIEADRPMPSPSSYTENYTHMKPYMQNIQQSDLAP